MNAGKLGEIVGGLLLVILTLAFVAVGPLVFLWSLNTLFPVLAIPYALETWAAAAFVLGIALNAARGR